MWQTVLQMKQSEPSVYRGGGPVLEVDASNGKLQLIHNWHRRWSTPIVKRRWLRIALNVRYSQSGKAGWVRMFVDRNGDGDAGDRRERSPRFHVSTLKTELSGGSPGGLRPGAPIPSHLRVGIYHDPPLRLPGAQRLFGPN